MPGGTFHTQETEDVAAWQTYRVDAALQADGTLRGAGGAGGVCSTVVTYFLYQLGGSRGIQGTVQFSRACHTAERNTGVTTHT